VTHSVGGSYISASANSGWLGATIAVSKKGTGVRINVLSPGAVDTPSLRIALTGSHGAGQVQAQVDKMGEGNPTGRLADPREMGKAAVFLSSDASSYVTGVELFVDGGLAQTG